MKTIKMNFSALSISAALLIAGSGWAQTPYETGTSQREASPGSVTADQQGETEADRETTRRIRQAVTDDSSLSINARNVKIITVNGTVFLRGVVDSETEKTTIEQKAAGIVGTDKVSSELEVAPGSMR